MREEIEYFKLRYSALHPDEFSEIVARAANSPESLNEFAVAAIKELIEERGTTASSIIGLRHKQMKADQAYAAAKEAVSSERSNRWLGAYSRIFAFAGLLVAILIILVSVSYGHIGGVAAGALTFFCAIWLLRNND